MQQTKLSSLVETICNTIIGYLINYVANIIIFPIFGLSISLKANLVMGLIYTVISVARSYILRRWFNAHLSDASASIAAWWITISARFSISKQ